MNDQLANNFTEEVNIQLVKKNLLLQKVILVCVFLYSVLSSIYWIIFYFHKVNGEASITVIWLVKIYPVIAVLVTILSVVYSVLAFNACKLILSSFQKRDAALFNKGYNNFYNAGIIGLIGTLVSIVIYIVHLSLTASI